MGIETEYGIASSDSSGAHIATEPAVIAEQLFADMQQRTGSTSAFLENGGRLYLDIGDHPEYATAECTQLADLLAQDRAGDELLVQMAQVAQERLETSHIHLFKNNVDTAQHSYGCHENYLVRRRLDFLDRLNDLVPFFVTRQLLVGAGYVYHEPGTVRFELSQRARHMHGAVSTSSTRTRPMINTRDEPHADAENYRRMHVIVGDSNMSSATTALKVGMTNAVLNVMEDGVRLPSLQLLDPMRAIRDVAQDLSGRVLLERANGQTISATEVQAEIFQIVREHYERAGWFADLDPLMRYAFDLWERALHAFETNDFGAVHTEIEWIAKYELITRYRHRFHVPLSDDRISRLELAWHDVSSAGLRSKLEQSGVLKSAVSDDDVARAMHYPPQTSRARIRSAFIHAARRHHRDFSADWGLVRLFNDGNGVTVGLSDPFATSNADIEALIDSMENNE
ncbi:proteasome accessory factor PafA2 family protein [Arcanobacterium phocisimile]|uniref:Proteasome accessory factor PafA2 family protein n=2 Tax=Arcanobacterium phocisimile TaxID=1302235 RepID=A0ABX7IJW5_9ACTO|nr:proteasome accessory factor PafA2 family protein [Arcanobacterium phocisimile]